MTHHPIESQGSALIAFIFLGIPMLGSEYVMGLGLTLLMMALTQSWVILSAMTGHISWDTQFLV